MPNIQQPKQTEWFYRRRRLVVTVGMIVLLVVLIVLLGLTVYTGQSLAASPELPLTTDAAEYQGWQLYYPAPKVTKAHIIHIPVPASVVIDLSDSTVSPCSREPESVDKIDPEFNRFNQLELAVFKPGIYQGQCTIEGAQISEFER